MNPVFSNITYPFVGHIKKIAFKSNLFAFPTCLGHHIKYKTLVFLLTQDMNFYRSHQMFELTIKSESPF